MRWLNDLSLEGKRVLLRADFNVPLRENGEVVDDFRIQAILPTAQYVLSQGGKLILMSHLGDPEGKREERLRLNNVQKKLQEHLSVLVTMATDCVGEEVEQQVKSMKAGEVLLLENLRFHKEEEENDQEFTKALARLGDLYISDAFGVLHREHASVVSLPKLLPQAGGLLLQKEIEGLQKLLGNPERPMVAIIGGRKIESKVPVIDKIAALADELLLGNLLAREVKKQEIVLKSPSKIIFPPDGLPVGKEYDIGPKTRQLFVSRVKEAKTVFWSGPLGKYEEQEYAEGSKIVAQAIAKERSYAVAGGGNLLDFLGRYGLRDKFDHISTGGSSMLTFLAGEQLPGLKALNYYD